MTHGLQFSIVAPCEALETFPWSQSRCVWCRNQADLRMRSSGCQAQLPFYVRGGIAKLLQSRASGYTRQSCAFTIYTPD